MVDIPLAIIQRLVACFGPDHVAWRPALIATYTHMAHHIRQNGQPCRAPVPAVLASIPGFPLVSVGLFFLAVFVCVISGSCLRLDFVPFRFSFYSYDSRVFLDSVFIRFSLVLVFVFHRVVRIVGICVPDRPVSALLLHVVPTRLSLSLSPSSRLTPRTTSSWKG